MKKTYQHIRNRTVFEVPKAWSQIKTIDMHTGGEPLRVILEGFPQLMGRSVLDYRRYCQEYYDHLRTALIFEPRGHADMYGCLLLPPNDAEGDFGILFLHNDGYSTMCGHAIIAISTLAIQMSWITVKEGDNELKIDAPCGRITSYAKVEGNQVTGVRFHCVPSFVLGLDNIVHVPGLGEVKYDLAYGGAYYAYVDMEKHNFDFELGPQSYSKLIMAGMAIKNAVVKTQSITHPFEKDLAFLYGTIFIDNSRQPSGNDSRNVCVFANGELDRCPTGSGVAGRVAIHRARHELDYGQIMTIESINGSVFRASLVSECDYGPYKAVIPQVEGTAYITGTNTFVIDPNDPMKTGFFLR